MAWHLQITIDRHGPESLREQLRSGIKQMIRTGVLRPGAPLPSSRRLAADLRLARSVVVEVYQQLAAEGYLTSVSRSGTRVADLALAAVSGEGPSLNGEPLLDAGDGLPVRWDLRTGLADVSGFPRREWLACLQQVLQTATPAHLEYPPLAGTAELCAELAAYVGRVRAVQTTSKQFMITAGFAQGLALICHMLIAAGHDTIGLEDPGHPGQRRFIEGIGLRCVSIPVDDEGIDVHALAASGTRAVLVTPAHQFPTGVVLSPCRRAAMVDWARRVDGLVLEDDYDGEFWFDSAERLPSMQGLAPERVVYGGSASKSLAPGLRLGWLAVPPALMPALERARSRQDLGASTIDQLAYAEFIRSGRLDRHLRRMRQRYRERRDTLVQVLTIRLPEARVIGSAAGLHTFVALPEQIDERAVVRAALRRGVVVRSASQFSFDLPPPAPGLVVGYAVYPPDSLAAAATALADAVRAVDRAGGAVHVNLRHGPQRRTAG